MSPGFGDEEGCAARLRAALFSRSLGLHAGEIASRVAVQRRKATTSSPEPTSLDVAQREDVETDSAAGRAPAFVSEAGRIASCDPVRLQAPAPEAVVRRG